MNKQKICFSFFSLSRFIENLIIRIGPKRKQKKRFFLGTIDDFIFSLLSFTKSFNQNQCQHNKLVHKQNNLSYKEGK